MGKVHDLCTVKISQRVYNAWLNSLATSVVAILGSLGEGQEIRPQDIPDEQFRELDDGSGEIFVSLPYKKEIKMAVPMGEWDFI